MSKDNMISNETSNIKLLINECDKGNISLKELETKLIDYYLKNEIYIEFPKEVIMQNGGSDITYKLKTKTNY